MTKIDPALTLAISTQSHRLAGLHLPDPHPNVDFIVLTQTTDGAEQPGHQPVIRDDVRHLTLQSNGVAASRNAAIKTCETEFLIFADDDIRVDLSGTLELLSKLQARPGDALAVGRRDGLADRRYPDRPHRLRHWNCARIATPELMIRVAPVRQLDLWFDPHFGLGAQTPSGDEFIFVTDALKAGLTGWYHPVSIGTHPPRSTGSDWDDPVLLAARRRVLGRVFGPLAPLVRCAFALRHRRRLGGWSGALAFARGKP